MRFRAGLVIGFATGYYLGAKAGYGRYEQLRNLLHDMPVDRVLDKGRAAVELAVERVRTSASDGDTGHAEAMPPLPPVPPVSV